MVQSSSFGQLMRLWREERKVTLREVACYCGISVPYLSDIENGNRLPPPSDVLEKIMKVLSLSDTERLEFICKASAERGNINKELVEYMSTKAPSALRFIMLANECNLQDEFFQKLIEDLSFLKRCES